MGCTLCPIERAPLEFQDECRVMCYCLNWTQEPVCGEAVGVVELGSYIPASQDA